MKKYTSQELCHVIEDTIRIKGSKSLMSVLLSLSSEVGSESVTGLSVSEFFQYHYSVIGKVTGSLSDALSSHYEGLRSLGIGQYGSERAAYSIVSDFVAIHKPHSPSLEERTYLKDKRKHPDNALKSNSKLKLTIILSQRRDRMLLYI